MPAGDWLRLRAGPLDTPPATVEISAGAAAAGDGFHARMLRSTLSTATKAIRRFPDPTSR